MLNIFLLLILVGILLIMSAIFYSPSTISLSLPNVGYGKISGSDKFQISFRSRGEKRIADFLEKHNISYFYELPLPNSSFLCDFFLIKSKTYVEYWGLHSLQNEVGDRYRRRELQKRQYYDQLGLNVISIYEKDLKRLSRVFSEVLKLHAEV